MKDWITPVLVIVGMVLAIPTLVCIAHLCAWLDLNLPPHPIFSAQPEQRRPS